MMKKILKYWKIPIALILIGLAVFVHQEKYVKEKEAYETKVEQMRSLTDALHKSIQKNKRYESIQDDLEAAKAELDASRLDLYQHFPVELKEEDQIMYVLYLETLFNTEIFFNFSQAQPVTALHDGSTLQGMILQVNYQTTYEGFQEMVQYLASDDRVTSVYEATIEYDADRNIAAGVLTLVLYLVDNDRLEYMMPDVAIPQVGKENLFE